MRSSILLLVVLAPSGILSHTVSRDATCGGQKEYTCLGSAWGNCCSRYGWCGSNADYCGEGCKPAFGTCNQVTPPKTSKAPVQVASSSRTSSTLPVSSPTQRVTTDARCGPYFGSKTCLGSRWGDCCSQYSYCGSTNDYCAVNTCQKGYGKCNTVKSSRGSIQYSTQSSTSGKKSTSVSISSSIATLPSTSQSALVSLSSATQSSTTTPSSTTSPSISQYSTTSSSTTISSETISESSTVSSTIIASSSTSLSASASSTPSPACPVLQAMCGSQCFNLLTDPNNCGVCGRVCSSGICTDGICISPSCGGQTCDTFSACGPGGSCVCASITGGAGICADGQTPCAGLADCTVTTDCQVGYACAVGTCCTRNVCILVADACANSAAPRRLFIRRSGLGTTIAG